MTKIALILGGGASLGSYIAGVVTELLKALEGNENREAAPVTIGVVTGASAGALNAGLLARTLAVNRNLLPWIERAWVDAADADALLDPERLNRLAWLDSSVMEDLTRALIAADAAADDRPSPAVGDSVRIGFTLASLAGTRFDLPRRFVNAPGRRVGARRFADTISFEVRRGARADDPVWEEIRRAAIASAAFPFAFPPVPLHRRRSDYPGAVLPPGAGDLERWYVDGGLFDNAPLGLARRLVRQSPAGAGDEWRYVMVEPTIEGEEEAEPAEAEPASMADLGARLARAVLGQGAVRDWRRASEINDRLELLYSLIERVAQLSDRLADPEDFALGRQIGDLAERVAEREVEEAGIEGAQGSVDPIVDCLDRNVERIERDPRYGSILNREPTRAGRARLAKLIYVLEAACDLGGKEILPLYLVAPKRRGELAGDFLGNFGGFFSREWRENDFRAGRRDARRLLEDSLADIVRYRPDADEAYRVDPLDPAFDAIPLAARNRLVDLVEAETDRVLQQLRPGPLASALGWVWKPVVRRWVGERLLEALQRAR